MSTINVEVVEISHVKPHPNADRLDVAIVMGTTCVTQKGTFAEGDRAVWFPPNILIPIPVAEELGVTKYLHHAVYPGDESKSQCRVGAARLRGVPSYGFLIPADEGDNVGDKVGDNVSDRFQAVKYEPPLTGGPTGDPEPDHPAFHRYTDIENFYHHPNAIKEGDPIRITEKLHGANCRFGYIVLGEGKFEFMSGSNHRRLKPETATGGMPVYWRLFSDNISRMLIWLSNDRHSVVAFGEVFGPGIQDLDYGVTQPEVRLFDIAVDGTYLSHHELHFALAQFNVPSVPLLYVGPWHPDMLEQYTHGPQCVSATNRSAFKGREGIVVTPLAEQFSESLMGRLILKSVSVDYIARKGGTDN